MNKEAFKYVMNDIKYGSGKSPVFQIPSYEIKAFRSRVSKVDYMYFVVN